MSHLVPSWQATKVEDTTTLTTATTITTAEGTSPGMVMIWISWNEMMPRIWDLAERTMR